MDAGYAAVAGVTEVRLGPSQGALPQGDVSFGHLAEMLFARPLHGKVLSHLQQLFCCDKVLWDCANMLVLKLSPT